MSLSLLVNSFLICFHFFKTNVEKFGHTTVLFVHLKTKEVCLLGPFLHLICQNLVVFDHHANHTQYIILLFPYIFDLY